jgi:peptidoglycan hydrolase-like protein with peptidoglycan-binding domain
MLGPASKPNEPAAEAPQRSTRGLALWIAVAAVAVLALVGGVYLLVPSTPSAPVAGIAPAVPGPVADAPPSPEAVEAALQLTSMDRQHVQAALIALGYGVVTTDGVFGPHSREMIVAYQRARKDPATGFLTGPQNQALLREAASAVSAFDEEKNKIEEERKKLAAGAPPTSIDRGLVPLEDDKRINLSRTRGTCDAVVSYVARVYSNKLGLMFRGGWQTFEANASGDFAKEFTNPITRNKLLVIGNLKARAVSVENLGNGCVWKGSF